MGRENMHYPVVEICCGGYYDALQACEGGSTRIELNAALSLGGVTPTLGTLRLVKRDTCLKVVCMDRPRAGGFCYSREETAVMFEDAGLMLENGADGIAFGFLTNSSEIDIEKTRRMVRLVHGFDAEAVFHRAFDVVPDALGSCSQLVDAGVDRILTSGQEPEAVDGIPLIKQLQDLFGNDIQLLAGSGINSTNAGRVIAETGIGQVHSSCREYVDDPTTIGASVSFEYASRERQPGHEVVSRSLVERLIDSLEAGTEHFG